MKYFRMSYDAILWEISWANLNMLLATIPTYDTDKEDKEDKEDKDEPVQQVQDIAELSTFLNLPKKK